MSGESPSRRVAVDHLGLPRIAILGANSQVGTELALFLKVMGRIEPIGIARSSLGTTILRRAGIQCRHGEFRTEKEGHKLLQDCCGVVDLALPTGNSPVDTKRIIRERFGIVFGSLGSIRQFIYASTAAIYRLDPAEPFYRWYGATKHFAEKEATRLGARTSTDVFNLRLGQVHGEMQSCSLSFLEQLNDGAVVHVNNLPSLTVFVFSIAEAISNIVEGKEVPGTYTLTSVPAWSWSEVILWYAALKGVDVTVEIEGAQPQVAIAETYRIVAATARAITSRLVNHYRDLLSAGLATISEGQEARLRFSHLLHRVQSEVAGSNQALKWEPFRQRVIVPGRRLSSLSDSRQSMAPYAAQVRAILAALPPTFAGNTIGR